MSVAKWSDFLYVIQCLSQLIMVPEAESKVNGYSEYCDQMEFILKG
jgi:hypothetical protein